MANELFCGTPQQLDSGQIAARDSLNARLRGRLETVPCLCGASDFDGLATLDRYGIEQPTVICRACGLMQSNPRMASADLVAFYESDEYRLLYDGADFDYETNYRRDRSHIARALSGCRSVIELGCGGGWNLTAFRDTRVVGYDFSPKLIAMGRKRGLDLRQGSIDEAVRAGERFDAVVLNHVLEHLPDPVDTLRKLHALSDTLFVGVPDVRMPWIEFLQNAHLYYFTPATLSHYLARAGWAPGPIESGPDHEIFTVCKSGHAEHLLAGEYEESLARLKSGVLKVRLTAAKGRVRRFASRIKRLMTVART
jgi:SAM-dependent methyltransferase